MAFGTLGSTLNDELNRLANGGTYRDKDDMVDEALAAKQWANRENIVPYSTDTVGILNEIAALGPNRQNWFDFNGVCNYLAGTTGLPAAAALRQITTTGDILTSLAGFYTDATTPRYNYPGYIYIPGIATQYISTPDAPSLDVTGDIDIRVKVALDDWTPVADTERLITKRNVNFAYGLKVTTTGAIQLNWTENGTTQIAAVSTVAPTVADGAPLWVRVTLDVDNGASGNTTTFYTSTDGTNWTQLGSTVVKAGTTSIYSSSDTLFIGTDVNSGYSITGKLYNAQIFASINGTDKRFDMDLTTNVTSATYDQFTATTGQLCTINGQNTLTNGGSAGALLPITVGSSLAADSNDAKFLDHTGTNYVYLPGGITNTLSVPDSAAFDITGDLDIRVQMAMDDWTPSVFPAIIGNADASAGYALFMNSSGYPILYWYEGVTLKTATSTASPGFADGETGWIRVTLDVNDGAGSWIVRFYKSTDGVTWTEFNSSSAAGATSISASAAAMRIGAVSPFSGTTTAFKIYRAQILDGIDGTTVLDVDTSVITAGSATSFTAVTGQTVTINRSTSGRKTVAVTQPTWLFGTDDYMEVNNRYMAHSTSDENYVYLSGASGNYMSVADTPPLDVTGDLDIQFKVAMDDWTPSNLQTIISKYTFPNRSWGIEIQDGSVFTAGIIRFVWSEDGSAIKAANSTVTTGLADGATKWIRVTLDVNNGAGGNDVKFFTSDDGTNWTQLGSTVTQAGVTSIYSGTSPLWIGSLPDAGSRALKGKFYRAIVKNGIDGTTVLDANAAVITLPSQTTFTDSSSNAYTVTINKSGVGTFVSTGNYLYLPGIASNDATAPDSAALDITGDIDLRAKVAFDDWTPSAVSTIISKWTASVNLSYFFLVNTDGTLSLRVTTGGSSATQISLTSTVANGVTDGTTKWVRATRVASTGLTKFFLSDDGITWTQLGADVSGTSGNIFAGTSILRVGSQDSGGSPARGKFFRAQVLNGIDGTVAFDANFESSITSLTQASFTESSSNAATVTINRSGSTYRSAGVIDAGYLYPGATNTFANSTIDYLNFGATDSFTYLAIHRQWDTAISSTLIANRSIVGGAVEPGYFLAATSQSGGVNRVYAGVSGPTAVATTDSTSIPAGWTNGVLNTHVATVDRSTNLLSLTKNAGTATTVSTSAVNTPITTINTLKIGASTPIAAYAFMEFIAAAVFRQALTTAQIRQISNYFANREAYL